MPEKTRTSSRRSGGRARRPRAHAKPIRGNPFLVLLEEVRIDVESRLTGFLDARLDGMRPYGHEVTDLVGALRDLCLRGGKRVRPALLVAGYRAASSRADIEPALDAGVALELLHAFFLIHDDWMDQDAVRRGGPAVHTFFSRQYKSKHLGQCSAILAGDLGVALATEALARPDVPASRLPRIMAAFAQMQADAVAGQQLDLLGSADVETTYKLKTSSYTVRGPLLLGALLAGASPAMITSLTRYAMPIGVAFQLRDDLLSAFGDPSRTGKPFANDIRSGKRTLLVSYGLEMSRGSARSALRAAWGNPRATQPALRRAVSVLQECGALERVEQRITALVTEGLAALDSGNVSRPGQDLLRGAAEALAHRRQ